MGQIPGSTDQVLRAYGKKQGSGQRMAASLWCYFTVCGGEGSVHAEVRQDGQPFDNEKIS